MTSLKRSLASDPYTSNISSKVFVRSTKSGKVQKIVRELYLRQDIPCSSQLCTSCPNKAPRDAAGNRKLPIHLPRSR
jgi:exosome complex exonuclease DIS3/RRP44